MTKQIAIVGAGSMGLNMSLLFGDHDYKVSVFDVEGKNIDKVNELLKDHPERKALVTGFKDLDEFIKSLEGQRIFLFSLTHGKPVDEVIQKLKPYFKKGDIILDGGNEWYLETERRQKELKEIGVEYLGMGVSGGYQSARRGPSLCPGGEKSTYDKVSDILEHVSAKYHGSPCVEYIGPNGAGHYVKMVHNGIEQGMLSITSEAYEIMKSILGFDNDRIGKIFTEWNADGELKNNFLIKICGEIAPRKQDDGKHIVDVIEDRVVQDSDGSEGTGVWSVKEAAERHVPCPTIATAHFMRTASAHRDDREKVNKLWTVIGDNLKPATEDPEIILDILRQAVHAGFMASFIQGMNLIAQASIDFKWKLYMPSVLNIWRSGCIIEAEYISQLLLKAYDGQSKNSEPLRDVAVTKEVATEVNKSFNALKQIVLMSINAGAHVPALSASLEYFKYTASVKLPTAFEEAQLDYFGGHSYDTVNEDVLKIKKGSHHTEWKKP